MIEAVVGVALRAIVASVVLGGALAVLVFVATRTLRLTAATRHALWTTALFATALMPLAGVGVSLWRAAAPALLPAPAPVTASVRRAAGIPAATQVPVARRPVAAAAAPATTPLGRLADARWTPRMSPALALGLVTVWALGATGGIIGLLAGIVRVRGLKRRSSPLGGALADELPWLTAADAGREIYLRLSYETETPVAIGFRRPVILIPTDLATGDGLAAIEPLILHEHAHLRRYDDWSNLAQRAIERVFWFNPVVWLVGRRIALEREIASDDAVVEKTGAAHAYATSLWKLAREMRMPEHAAVAPGALLTRKQIVVRIERLLDTRRSTLRRSPAAAAGVALAGVLAVAFVASSAPAVELPAPSAPAALAAVPAPAAVPVRAGTPARTATPAPRVVRIVRVTTTQPAGRSVEHDAFTVAVPAQAAGEAVPPAPPAVAAPHRVVVIVPASPAAPRREPNESAGTAAPAQIGPQLGRAVHEALAALPADLAEQTRQQLAGRVHDGARATRETVAACLGCSFRNADLHGLDLHGLHLTADDFSGADLHGADLSGANLSAVHLRDANLAGADLRDARLTGVELRGANLTGARLDGTRMMGVSLSHVGLRGTAMRSVLTSCIGCDLAGLDLRGQDLHGITLTGADLSRADLGAANLAGAHLTGVDLSFANFAGADLSGARLDGCDLSHADLHGARTLGLVLLGSSRDG